MKIKDTIKFTDNLTKNLKDIYFDTDIENFDISHYEIENCVETDNYFIDTEKYFVRGIKNPIKLKDIYIKVEECCISFFKNIKEEKRFELILEIDTHNYKNKTSLSMKISNIIMQINTI